MINSVNMFNMNYSAGNNADNLSRQKQVQNTNVNNPNATNVAFGNRNDSYNSPGPLDALKDIALTITNDAVGFFGVNAALYWLQKNVNGKFLIGKINNHFTKNISKEDYSKLWGTAKEIAPKVGNPSIQNGPFGEAYYTELGNKVVVGPENHSALFHELGHAYEENKTSFLKKLQHGRGRYTELSMLLYVLLAQRQKPKNDFYEDENQGIGSKIMNFIRKSDAIIPLLAFSPELITEAAASFKGYNLLKTHNEELIKLGKTSEALSKSALKNIRNSYFTCFSTYLFVPLSIMLVDAIRNSADKAIQKRRYENSLF